MRRARIGLLLSGIGVWSAVIAGPLARPSVAATTSPEPKSPVDPKPGANPADAPRRSLKVDPGVKDGKAHHPLSLFVHAEGINGTPLVTTTTPTGYSPTTIKKYLGLTGTGSGQTIAIVVAYNAPNIAADLTTFDTAYGLPKPPK